MSKANNNSEEGNETILRTKRKWTILVLMSIPLTAVTAWAANGYFGYGYFSSAVDIGSNSGSATPFLTVGMGNVAGASNSAAIGANLSVNSTNSLVVGRHNKAFSQQVIPNGDTVLILSGGNGIVGDPERYKNVMEVYKDGTVVVNKAQGDISTGDFN